MHRQSLGSPNSKLDSNGVFVGGNENIQLELKIKQQQQQLATQLGGDEEQLRKAQKAHKSSGEKAIHLIPMLVIFCFLILYLISHHPSQKQEISSEIDKLGGVTANDVLGIGSTRKLSKDKEEFDNKKRTRINRKLPHF